MSVPQIGAELAQSSSACPPATHVVIPARARAERGERVLPRGIDLEPCAGDGEDDRPAARRRGEADPRQIWRVRRREVDRPADGTAGPAAARAAAGTAVAEHRPACPP